MIPPRLILHSIELPPLLQPAQRHHNGLGNSSAVARNCDKIARVSQLREETSILASANPQVGGSDSQPVKGGPAEHNPLYELHCSYISHLVARPRPMYDV